MLHAVVSEVVEELDWAPTDQDRLQDELGCTCEDFANAACENVNVTSAKLNGPLREVSNRRATHEAARNF